MSEFVQETWAKAVNNLILDSGAIHSDRVNYVNLMSADQLRMKS